MIVTKEDAHEVTSRAAGEEWMEQALAAVKSVAIRQPELTAPDVWETGLSLPENASPRVMGAVLARAAREGIIEDAKRIQKWRRGNPAMTGTEGQTARVWRSKIYEERRAA